MMRKILLLLGICAAHISISAQVLPPVDCTEALNICDSVVLQDTLKVAIDDGADEISAISCLPFGEIRGTWYKFGINDPGNLRFTITPFDTLADFDWALFRVDWASCSDIFALPAFEVSCNADGIGGGNYTTGATGLSQLGHNPAINLSTPALFYLYITTSIQDTAAVLGYTIDFSASDFELVPCNEIGIEEELGNHVNLYPNPVNDVLQVQLNTITNNSLIYLYDMSGRNVLTFSSIGTLSAVDVSSLRPGVYMLEVHSDNGISRKKVVKN
jgi:Secretion system C-terminal sorting domain